MTCVEWDVKPYNLLTPPPLWSGSLRHRVSRTEVTQWVSTGEAPAGGLQFKQFVEIAYRFLLQRQSQFENFVQFIPDH